MNSSQTTYCVQSRGRNFLVAGLLVLVCFSATRVLALSGVCSDCHTMHYSQDGSVLSSWGEGGPYNALLTTDCAGCHTGENSSAIPLAQRTPYVMSSASGANALAGGSFFWVSGGDDSKGHNVDGLSAGDSTLATPPGFDGSLAAADGSVPGGGSWPSGKQMTCAGTYGCHGSHSTAVQEAAIAGAHHANIGGAITAANAGADAGSGYRMLVGIAGYEDPQWELSPTVTDHNQYYGVSKTDGTVDNHTISSLCMRCHNDFHQARSGSSGGWLSHPVDFDMGDTSSSSEVRNYGGDGNPYSVDAPVASTLISTPLSVVTFNDDTIVTCLSCHRAHGSEYDKLLRWDYQGALEGCSICHTSKD